MSELSQVTLDEFKKVLTFKHLLPFRLIYVALVLGVLMFFGVVLVMRSSREPGGTSETLGLLMGICALMGLGCVGAAFAFPRFMYSEFMLARFKPRPSPFQPAPSPPEACTALMQQAALVQMALLEGFALFSLVLLILGASWLMALGVVPLLAYAVFTFPTRDRLLKIFVLRIRKEPQLLYEQGL